MDIGGKKRGVVVAAVPDDDVGLLLGPGQDLAVIDAAVNDDAPVHQGLVFFPLLDGQPVPGKVRVGGEALHHLAAQIPIRHGMAHHHRPLAPLPQDLADFPGGRGFAAAGPDGTHCDHRLGRSQHGPGGTGEQKIGPCGRGQRGPVHHLDVGHVAIRKNHQVCPVLPDQRRQFLLRVKRDALGVEGPGQLRGVNAVVHQGNLGRGKGRHLILGVVLEQQVEIMKIPAGRAHDYDFFRHAASPRLGQYLRHSIIAEFFRSFDVNLYGRAGPWCLKASDKFTWGIPVSLFLSTSNLLFKLNCFVFIQALALAMA